MSDFELTLDPKLEGENTKIEEDKPQEVTFTAEEQQMIDAFSAQIDISDMTRIMNYGAGTQQKMAGFADKALESVRTQDTDEIGEMLTGLVKELRGFDPQEEKGLFGFFKKASNKVEALKARYDTVEMSVDKIVTSLEQNQVQLLKDISTLDQMYDMNKGYFKELSMYIAAGRKKLDETVNGELAQLKAKALSSGKNEDAQAANDLQAQVDRFEKKLSDLDLTRMIAIQTAPQIRLIQNNDAMMAEKIQSTIVNTIPLWKNQMLLALGISHSKQALKAQQAVSDMTNELLKKNAAALKQATVETAKEAQRGIVDIETLQETNAALIETLDEVMRIQAESREKRQSAETELRKMEEEVKQTLLRNA